MQSMQKNKNIKGNKIECWSEDHTDIEILPLIIYIMKTLTFVSP